MASASPGWAYSASPKGISRGRQLALWLKQLPFSSEQIIPDLHKRGNSARMSYFIQSMVMPGPCPAERRGRRTKASIHVFIAPHSPDPVADQSGLRGFVGFKGIFLFMKIIFLLKLKALLSAGCTEPLLHFQAQFVFPYSLSA